MGWEVEDLEFSSGFPTEFTKLKMNKSLSRPSLSFPICNMEQIVLAIWCPRNVMRKRNSIWNRCVIAMV